MKSKVFFIKGERSLSFYFMLPAIILTVGILIYPIINAFWISLNKINFMTGEYKFIVFKNYIDIILKSELLKSLQVTFIYSLCVIFGTLILGLIIALLLNKNFKARGFCIAILLIPWAIAPVVNGIMWKWIFNPRFGFFNNFLLSIGVMNSFENFLIMKWPAMIIVILTAIYKWIPFTTFLLIASLQTVPRVLYEAGEVDGVSPIGSFFKITLPLIRPSLVIVLIFLSVASLKTFDTIYVLTSGGPGYETSVINYMAYLQTFKYMNFGQGASLAFLISIIILFVNIIYYKLFLKEVRYD